MTDAATPLVRPPQQERSRAAWTRALDAGCALLEAGGIDAVTVTDVCRLSRMSPPSLYARVDGRAGLIAAIYEHGMRRVRALEDSLLTPVDPEDASVEQRVRHVATAMTELFRREQHLLRAVIGSSVQDTRIHSRGVEEALRVQAAMMRVLNLPEDAGHDIAAMIFAELVVNTVYGGEFTADPPADDDVFVARLIRMGVARARQ
ncbi:TetR/AcrR family transcriptional regulator [Microbacterium sp. B2969]|uniref:TetR/AcrR family transcriptional regulator n=1 Tax=Microbacterium alkaliflavum TaxID=3248839 RepID=A0ABW7QEP4_9MICO